MYMISTLALIFTFLVYPMLYMVVHLAAYINSIDNTLISSQLYEIQYNFRALYYYGQWERMIYCNAAETEEF